MRNLGITLVALTFVASALAAEPASNPYKRRPAPPVVGRWDLVCTDAAGKTFPSWIEIEQSGYRTLVGRYVGKSGSSRPIGKVEFDEATGTLRFALPPQWEKRLDDIVVAGKLEGDSLKGETTDDKGGKVTFEAKRAPSLVREKLPHWGEAVELFNGKDLSGLKARWSEKNNGWIVRDGLLVNDKPGNDLMTEQTFTDFKLSAEFRYPKKSNSGIYLRGRYEVQIEDTAGQDPDSHKAGGVYGFLVPLEDAAKPAGQWQTIEITLVGRVVTVTLNGEEVITRQAIPGITGGSLDSNEGEAGPILIQGDHGPIEFRKLTITPAK